jgi:hypothetical protein
MDIQNIRYTALEDEPEIPNSIPIQDNPNIIPRSSLRNFAYDQIQQDQIIATTKRYIQNSINCLILLLSLPFMVTDLVIVSKVNTTQCIKKIINLSNNSLKNHNHNIIYSRIEFSLFVYFIIDCFLSLLLPIFIYYFINIETNVRFNFKKYKETLRVSIVLVLFQTIWIILGTLTIIDKELLNICDADMYIYSYINIATKIILSAILLGIIISNYHIL